MNSWWCHSTFAQCVFATSSRDYLFYVCRGEGKCDSMQSNASKPNGKMNSPSRTKLPWRCLVNSLINAKRVPAGTKKLLPRGFCECSITMLFSYVSGQQWIDSNKTCRRIAGNLDCHGNAAIRQGCITQWGASRASLEATGCHHLLSACAVTVGSRHGRRIQMNTQNTNKTKLLASNFGTFRLLVVCENLTPKQTL